MAKGKLPIPWWAFLVLGAAAFGAYWWGQRRGSTDGSLLDLSAAAEGAPAPQYPAYTGYGAVSGSNPGFTLDQLRSLFDTPTPTPAPSPAPAPVVEPGPSNGCGQPSGGCTQNWQCGMRCKCHKHTRQCQPNEHDTQAAAASGAAA